MSIVDNIKRVVIPEWGELCALLVCAVALVLLGVHVGSTYTGAKKDKVIATQKADYLSKLESSERTALAAQAKVRAAEHKASADLAALGEKLNKELSHEKNRADRLDADLHSGTARVSVPIRLPPSRSSAVGKTAPAASGGDGTGYAELSGEAAADLFRIIDDADAVAIRLGACQKVIRKYQDVCGHD